MAPEVYDVSRSQVSLGDLLDPVAIRCGVRAASWQEAVAVTGDALRATGCVEDRYTNAMRDLVEESGPYMVIAPGIALLHARPTDGVRTAGLAVVTLADAVEFGHSTNDPVWLLIGLAANDDRTHVAALAQLATVLEDPNAIVLLRRARTPDDVLAAFALEPILTRRSRR